MSSATIIAPVETRLGEATRDDVLHPNTAVERLPHPLQWEVAGIVAELRHLRNGSLAQRQRLDRPVKLPLRHSLNAIMAGLSRLVLTGVTRWQ